jgi:hypothetical protein
MYKKLANISNESVIKLEALNAIVKQSNEIQHVGVNGYNKLSVYTTSKWYDWTRAQKQEFKNCFAPELVEQSLIGWLLTFPRTTGFLDLMDYWKDTDSAGVIVAYALDNNEIYLNGTRVVVHQGEGIAFSLRTEHEVKKKAIEQKWACMMLLSMPE